MSKPIIAETENGAQYGFPDKKTALRMFPDAKIVSYQDGTPYEKADESKPVSKMNRDELEAKAIQLNIANPDDKELFPNVASLRDAVTEAESADV